MQFLFQFFISAALAGSLDAQKILDQCNTFLSRDDNKLICFVDKLSTATNEEMKTLYSICKATVDASKGDATK